MSDIEKAIINTIQVDDEGLKNVKVVDINEIQKLGVEDLPAFLDGVLDAENDNDVESFNVDYIKGYKYGKTGTF